MHLRSSPHSIKQSTASINQATKIYNKVPNEVPNDCDMATELVPKEIENDPEHNHQDLTATDITAEKLDMEIEREDYRKHNRTKPLLEMFTKWHTEGSRNYGRIASRITSPEAYQMTTEKPTDILPKLPTEMAAEKSTKKSTTKLTDKVYQVDQDSLKHRLYWNQPPPEDFHWGRRIRGRR